MTLDEMHQKVEVENLAGQNPVMTRPSLAGC
jgi:hypothetical protein